MKKVVLFGICLTLAILCLVYGIVTRAAGSGTGFYMVWFAMAALFVGLGVTIHLELWSRLPGAVRIVTVILCSIFLLSFVIIEGCVISHIHDKGEDGLDYVIVLGAQMRQNGPSIVLQYRLDKAIEYLNDNPDTICIVSGGQGKNEPWSEAQGMAQYLKTQGIDENRIRLENQSLTTEQNVTNSQKLMEEGASVGIVTNDFHVFRAKQIAKKYGLKDVCGIAAGSSPLYLPNNMLREFFAEIKFLVF